MGVYVEAWMPIGSGVKRDAIYPACHQTMARMEFARRRQRSLLARWSCSTVQLLAAVNSYCQARLIIIIFDNAASAADGLPQRALGQKVCPFPLVAYACTRSSPKPAHFPHPGFF